MTVVLIVFGAIALVWATQRATQRFLAWRRRHRCALPDADVAEVGTVTRCPGCGAVYRLEVVHVEDVVAVDNASLIDVGYDVRAWTTLS